MIFGLDYDGCSASDIPMWREIITLMKNRGHRVYIVTMRFQSECGDVLENFGDLVDGIVPTGRESKQSVMLALGLNVSVWIDDNPQAIHHSAKQIWGTCSEEGVIFDVDHENNTLTPVKTHPHPVNSNKILRLETAE